MLTTKNDLCFIAQMFCTKLSQSILEETEKTTLGTCKQEERAIDARVFSSCVRVPKLVFILKSSSMANRFSYNSAREANSASRAFSSMAP